VELSRHSMIILIFPSLCVHLQKFFWVSQEETTSFRVSESLLEGSEDPRDSWILEMVIWAQIEALGRDGHDSGGIWCRTQAPWTWEPGI